MPRRSNLNKKSLIIGNLIGGLGNQLFIIFTVIAYSLKNNTEYAVINSEKKRKSYFDTNLYKNLIVFKQKLSGFITYKEPHYHFKEIPKYDRIILKGYFQSPKYFNDYKEQIIAYLDIFQEREILDYDGFLHFRLGDYKNIECHPVCGIEYYIKSLEDIYEKDENNLRFIYYFEEEDRLDVENKINILREKFERFTFEPVDTNMLDYKQMLSMTTMKYCIIANSSFSWWGAYLNEHPNKIIYLPSKWFSGSLNHYNTSELICNDKYISV